MCTPAAAGPAGFVVGRRRRKKAARRAQAEEARISDARGGQITPGPDPSAIFSPRIGGVGTTAADLRRGLLLPRLR